MKLVMNEAGEFFLKNTLDFAARRQAYFSPGNQKLYEDSPIAALQRSRCMISRVKLKGCRTRFHFRFSIAVPGPDKFLDYLLDPEFYELGGPCFSIHKVRRIIAAWFHEQENENLADAWSEFQDQRLPGELDLHDPEKVKETFFEFVLLHTSIEEIKPSCSTPLNRTVGVYFNTMMGTVSAKL